MELINGHNRNDIPIKVKDSLIGNTVKQENFVHTYFRANACANTSVQINFIARTFYFKKRNVFNQNGTLHPNFILCLLNHVNITTHLHR